MTKAPFVTMQSIIKTINRYAASAAYRFTSRWQWCRCDSSRL